MRAILGLVRNHPEWCERAGISRLAGELARERDYASRVPSPESWARIGRVLGLAEARLERALAEQDSGDGATLESVASAISILSGAVWLGGMII